MISLLRDLPIVKRMENRLIIKNLKHRLGLNPGRLGGIGKGAYLGGVRRQSFVTYPATPTKVFFPAGIYYARRILGSATPTTASQEKIIV